MPDPAVADSQKQVLALQSLIRDGLESHHTLRGTCAFRFAHDERLNFSVHLGQGHVGFSPGVAAGADAAVTMQPSALAFILASEGQIDFRDPTLAEAVKVEGATELYLHVAHSWLRPTELELRMLARAEERSRQRQQAGPIERLERLEAPSEAEVLKRIQASTPFIITGCMPEKLVGMTLAQFGATYGHVGLSLAGEDAPVSLATLLSRIGAKKDGELYTRGTVLPDELVPLFPPAYFAEQVSLPQIWFGAGRNPSEPVTPLHRDCDPGFLLQVFGRKRLTLFPPHEAACVYPKGAFCSYQLCWVKPHAPDLEQFPRFKEAHPVEVLLSPGEMLVQPTGWFHQVYSLDEVTLSVSHFLIEE
ncbi:cupin-like domain-containing protein [Hyalangium gracile]|uniref:cupin-like domain-containing protein n=1 Tax=Hyalangium gracile TaxID=394092 RepID=UPI001CCFCEAE|nr:cupin-like domain-containing protein [Hyalangium gracile]